LEPRIVLKDGKKEMVPVEVFSLCTTCDHRVIDGATAAMFNRRVKQLIEDPSLLAMQLQ